MLMSMPQLLLCMIARVMLMVLSKLPGRGPTGIPAGTSRRGFTTGAVGGIIVVVQFSHLVVTLTYWSERHLVRGVVQLCVVVSST